MFYKILFRLNYFDLYFVKYHCSVTTVLELHFIWLLSSEAYFKVFWSVKKVAFFRSFPIIILTYIMMYYISCPIYIFKGNSELISYCLKVKDYSLKGTSCVILLCNLLNICTFTVVYYCSMDDLLISAPMYSPEFDRPEYGRVYVYRNDQVSFQSTYYFQLSEIY